MISLILIKLLLIFVSSTISQPTLPWNLTLTARAIEPLVRDNSGSLTNQRPNYQTFNDNTNFGIIIKQGTTFSLTVETPSKIEDLKFFCFPYPQHEKKLIKLNLTGKTNCTNTLTTNYNCVPMVSASKNVPLRMIIKTKNWFPLSTNKSNDVSLPKSQGKGISHKLENNLKYEFDALGLNDEVFLKIFINYKNMTIELQQLQKGVHAYFKQEVYFWISLERNGLSIFEYKFLGCPPCGTKLINAVEKFELNDVIHFYHAEPGRFKSNLEGLNNESERKKFLLSNKGLQTVKRPELNNLKYSFHALGYKDLEFLTILINYKNMTIELQQLQKEVHSSFGLYFSISLERNGLSIFEYKLIGYPAYDIPLINAVEKFEFNDVIRFYHAEPGRFISFFEGLNYKKTSNTFILSNTGLETLK